MLERDLKTSRKCEVTRATQTSYKEKNTALRLKEKQKKNLLHQNKQQEKKDMIFLQNKSYKKCWRDLHHGLEKYNNEQLCATITIFF